MEIVSKTWDKYQVKIWKGGGRRCHDEGQNKRNIIYFVVRQINDRDAAYDLTQEIFISMLRSIGSYREKLASFRTWLYRIAENKVIDFRRRSIRWTVSLENIYLSSAYVLHKLSRLTSRLSAFRTLTTPCTWKESLYP